MAKIFSDNARRRISRTVRYIEGLRTPPLKARQTPTPAKRGEMFQTFVSTGSHSQGLYFPDAELAPSGYGEHIDWSLNDSDEIICNRYGYYSYAWRIECEATGNGSGAVKGALVASLVISPTFLPDLGFDWPSAVDNQDSRLWIQYNLAGGEKWTLFNSGVYEVHTDGAQAYLGVSGPDLTPDDWSFTAYLSLGEWQSSLDAES